MKKIPTIFKRNPENPALVMNEVNPVTIWVFRGEGVATRKYDGTAVMIREGKLYKRYDCKKGRMAPSSFIPADNPDPVTGHWPGWIDASDDKWLKEALGDIDYTTGMDGTYELIGPWFQGRDSPYKNPENVTTSLLVRHGEDVLTDVPEVITLFTLYDYFLEHFNIEGIVWHHTDGRMAKIKLRDFGLVRRNQ